MRNLLAGIVLFLCSLSLVFAAQYDPGASDTEIKIGNTAPYTGPVAVAQTVARVEKAYFDKINAEGGINGRKINFISLDDAYSPPKTVEQTRALIQKEGVLFVFSPTGTQNNIATRQYFNQQRVPQLMVSSGAPDFFEPKKFPWTTGFLPAYADEGHVYGAYVAKNYPNAKIAVLYQNDSLGKAYLEGFKKGLGSKKNNIVRSESYELVSASLDAQMANLKASGATVFFNAALGKFAAQTLRKMNEIDWHPTLILNFINANREIVFKPVGYEKVQGVVTARFLKDPSEININKNDQAIDDYYTFMKKYAPGITADDQYAVYGYVAAQTIVDVLKRCGDDLTRKNVLKQATNFTFVSPMLINGINVTMSPSNYYPFKNTQMMQFKGENWVPVGGLVSFKTYNVPKAP